MTKEIKFRAWSKEHNMFLRFTLLDAFESEKDQDGWNYLTIEVIKNAQQYTGLKDKNGVEIYEGDLLWYLYPFVDAAPKMYVVRWEELHLGWEFRRYDGRTLVILNSAEMNEELEVCGNIFENNEMWHKEGKNYERY